MSVAHFGVAFLGWMIRRGHYGFVRTKSTRPWREEYSEHLRGKQITVIADADQPDRRHAQYVAASLADKAESIKVLEFAHAKDLSEWTVAGGTRDALLNRIQNTPEWKPQAVESVVLLTKVFGFIRRFVSLTESRGQVASLWVVHTHVFSSVDASPYPAITSAEKQSGKTRLLEVLETLVANPWLTGRVTAAVLTRKIDAKHPTLWLERASTHRPARSSWRACGS